MFERHLPINRVYKICLLIAVLALVFAFGNFAWAQGAGYFLEKGQEFFIFDNLYINGYLAVENTLSTKTGILGDVLVSGNLNLDANNSFNFCKDARKPVSNAPDNKDCQTKVLIWNPASQDTPASLNVVSNDFYQMQVNKIQISGSTLEFKSLADNAIINTNSPVRLTGCFTNATGAGNDICSLGELKTNHVYLSSFANLSICRGGSQSGKVCVNNTDCPGVTNGCNNELILSPSNLRLNNIDLGPNLGNQNLCTIISAAATCPSDTQPPAHILTYSGGLKICCYLNISF